MWLRWVRRCWIGSTRPFRRFDNINCTANITVGVGYRACLPLAPTACGHPPLQTARTVRGTTNGVTRIMLIVKCHTRCRHRGAITLAPCIGTGGWYNPACSAASKRHTNRWSIAPMIASKDSAMLCVAVRQWKVLTPLTALRPAPESRAQTPKLSLTGFFVVLLRLLNQL
jgi:hypothetical protein